MPFLYGLRYFEVLILKTSQEAILRVLRCVRPRAPPNYCTSTPEGKWGTLVLHSVGRRSGKEREAILGYVEDGPNLVTMAMNGWADPEPAWWLNLQDVPTRR